MCMALCIWINPGMTMIRKVRDEMVGLPLERLKLEADRLADLKRVGQDPPLAIEKT